MKKNILLIGAGRSSTQLVEYLLKHSFENQFTLFIADYQISNFLNNLKKHPNLKLITLSTENPTQIDSLIQCSDIVISLLPANLHYSIALKCLEYHKNLVTASYVSPCMQELDKKVKEKGLIFLNEIGLDPGIDHISTMNLLENHIPKGAKIISYKSHCGGILSDQTCDNLWQYKFSWNPTNIVLAAQGAPACFLDKGQIKYHPYNNIFKRAYSLENQYGNFEVYANRDSLKYQKIYGLHQVDTIQRTTIRRPGFCDAWSILIDLGLTDNTQVIQDLEKISYGDFFSRYLTQDTNLNIRDQIQKTLGYLLKDDSWAKIQELKLWDTDFKIDLCQGTAAEVLEKFLLLKWSLNSKDTDMVIMHHQIHYKVFDQDYIIQAVMRVIGQDSTFTAMAKTVGLPVGIATLKILDGTIKDTGVCLPISKSIYRPILQELEKYNINFEITTTNLT